MWTEADVVAELYLLMSLSGAGRLWKRGGEGGIPRVAGGKHIPAEGTAWANAEGCKAWLVLGEGVSS